MPRTNTNDSPTDTGTATCVRLAGNAAVESANNSLAALEAGKITEAAAWADRSTEWAKLARRHAKNYGTDEARSVAATANAAAQSTTPAIAAWKARNALQDNN